MALRKVDREFKHSRLSLDAEAHQHLPGGHSCLAIVIIGPVVGCYAMDDRSSWRYSFYGGFVAQVVTPVALAIVYSPQTDIPRAYRGSNWSTGWRFSAPRLSSNGRAWFL